MANAINRIIVAGIASKKAVMSRLVSVLVLDSYSWRYTSP